MSGVDDLFARSLCALTAIEPPLASLQAALDWQPWDTWIVITAAIKAMSCTLPGVWLVLRQQSMMGDALSHTALPGVVLTFLTAQWLAGAGWISRSTLAGVEPLLLAAGAVIIGILTALLTEAVRKLGHVESSASLGVVFTSLFALGLLLIRLKADDVHIDPDCVLFGQLELAVWETVPILGLDVPLAALTSGGLLLVNTLLLMLFFKELRVATFDAAMATSLGIPASLIHYLLMGATAATVVMAFKSVGSILVVAILIVPAACGLLVCERLLTLILLSLAVAAGSALLGHLLAKTLPPMIFGPLGFPEVRDAGTPGMMAVACGLFFVLFLLGSPRQGLIGRGISRLRLTLKMAADDILAMLYRKQEGSEAGPAIREDVRRETSWIGPWTWSLAVWSLQRRGWVRGRNDLSLTPAGTEQAAALVRSHRLWESYLHKHFNLSDAGLHGSAHLVEHFLDRELQTQLDEELDSPPVDPHGKSIPP
jgi:manganese/zinc/iron transport system permease protein